MLKEPSAYPYQFANNRQQLHEILIQAPVPIVIYRGPSLIIELINNKCLEMWNKTRENVLNKPLFDVFPGAKEKGLEKIFETVYETGKTFTVTELQSEIMGHDKSGVSGWFNTSFE